MLGNVVLSQIRDVVDVNGYLDCNERVSSLLYVTEKLSKWICGLGEEVNTVSSSNEVELIYLTELASKLFHELKVVNKQYQDKSRCESFLQLAKTNK